MAEERIIGMSPSDIIYTDGYFNATRWNYYGDLGWGTRRAEYEATITGDNVVPYYTVTALSDVEAYVVLQYGVVNEAGEIVKSNYSYPTSASNYVSHLTVSGTWIQYDSSGNAIANGKTQLTNIMQMKLESRELIQQGGGRDELWTQLMLPFPVFKAGDDKAIDRWIRDGEIDNPVSQELPKCLITFEIDYNNYLMRFKCDKDNNVGDIDFRVFINNSGGIGNTNGTFPDGGEWTYTTLGSEESTGFNINVESSDKQIFMTMQYDRQKNDASFCTIMYKDRMLLTSDGTKTQLGNLGFITFVKPFKRQQ